MQQMRAIITTVALGAVGLALAGCQGRSGQGYVGGGLSGSSARPVSPAGKVLPAFAEPDAVRALGLREYPPANQIVLVAGDQVQSVRLLDDQLVVLTRKNMCYRVDAGSGVIYPLAEVAPAKSGQFKPPTYDGLHYFFAGLEKLIGVNAAIGRADVQIELEFPSATQAISDKEFVYAGGLDGRIFAYSIANEVAHWDSKYGPPVTSLGMSKGQLISARKDVQQGRGRVLSIRPKMWTDNWEQPTDGPITAPIACTDDAVFVACEDGSVYRFNADRGWEEWRVRTPGALVDQPIVLKDRIVQVVPGAGTWVLQLDRMPESDRQVMWKDPAILRYLASAGDRMYFFDGENLVCKQADTGKTLATANLRDASELIPVPNPGSSRIYLVGRSGQVVWFTDRDQPYLVIGQ